MKRYFFAAVVLFGLTSFGGCEQEATVIEPPAAEEDVVPVEGMTDEEYAKEMEKSLQ